MADVLTPAQRSYCMSQIKGKNTKIEILLKKYLRAEGIKGCRFKNNITGKPDIVFPKLKIAVFCDGCFWHKCPECYNEPKTNKRFWSDKICKNVERDKKVNSILKKEGWTVVRFWEHDLRKKPAVCYRKLLKAIDVKRGKNGKKEGRLERN